MQIIETRLYPPRDEPGFIQRAVSARILEFARSRRVTLVKAPAGYGKTTLMADCYRRLMADKCLVAWISLGESDLSIAEFAAYLARTLTTQGIDDTFEDLAAGSADSQVRRICNRLSAEFGQLKVPLFIFFDDAHALLDTESETLLAALLKESPEHVHWIIGSRSTPHIPLARMRALGQLGELGVEDMRFSLHESRELLWAKTPRGVSDAVVRLSHDRVEGWPVGLQLISIALQRNAVDESDLIVRRIEKHRDVVAFFREEVFAKLDGNMQSFLLHTSVLSRFTPELCDALTGQKDGRHMIERLEKSGLFVFALGEEDRWYRYHDMFAEFLLDILRDREPGQEATLHLHASNWFREHDLLGEAVEHAVRSGQQNFAAQLLDETVPDLLGKGEFVRAGRLIASLRPETLIRFPRLGLWYSVYLIVECRFKEVQDLLAALELLIVQHETGATLNERQSAELHNMLLVVRMLLAQFSDDIDGMERFCDELRKTVREDDDFFLRGTLQLALLVARRERYQINDCDELAIVSRQLFAKSGLRSMLTWHACVVGPLLVQRGQANEAVDLYRKALEVGRQSRALDAFALQSMTMAMLADVLLERNEREAAKGLFESAETCANGIGMLESWTAAYVSRARLAYHEGDMETAARLLNDGNELAVTRSFNRLRWQVAHERMREALAQGDVRTAQRIGISAGLPDNDAELRPAPGVTSIRETKALAWARLAIATGRHGDALRLVRAWMAFAEARGVLTTTVRMSLLAVRALHLSGDGRGALRTMKQAIALAARLGMIFCFLEEKEPVRATVLQSLEGEDPDLLSTPFYQRITAAFAMPVTGPKVHVQVQATPPAKISDVSAPVEALSQREVEILRLVGRSMLYKEIADTLGLTEGSVKWYMQQIYGKLGIRRRTRAVEKARSLGYM